MNGEGMFFHLKLQGCLTYSTGVSKKGVFRKNRFLSGTIELPTGRLFKGKFEKKSIYGEGIFHYEVKYLF